MVWEMWSLRSELLLSPKQVPAELGTQFPYLLDEVWVKTGGFKLF